MKIVGPVLLDAGRGPIRMEPVVADLKINRPGAKVTVLDADGRRTNRTVPVSGGKVRIDTSRDKSISYLVEFE
jgi:hypothetical protein